MSRRRDRSRSPVDSGERVRPRREHEERYKERHASRDDFQSRSDSHKPRNKDESYESRDRRGDNSKHDYNDRGKRWSPDRNRRSYDSRGDRESWKDGDRLHRAGDRPQRSYEDRDSNGREQRHDFRREQGQNDNRGDDRRPPYNRRQRDRRREREEEEPEDTSRYGQPAGEEGDAAATNAEEPNFGLSGKLTEYTNTYKGVVIKYNEPPEARKPKTRWRLYPFKGEEGLPVLYIHRQSAFLMGRQRHIADIPIDHPSCSKQHAVLQYKLADYERADGTKGRKIKPYILDLESANGTFLNNEKIDPRRYYELKERDVLKFGFSSREYVMLHEKSMNTQEAQEDGASSATSDSDVTPE